MASSGGLYEQTVTNYRGGVSQQPNILRYPNQLEEQINAYPSLVNGLQKRPPTLHVKKLSDKIDYTAVQYHIINRDENEQYILEMSNENLRVWDLQGNTKTVKFPNGTSYLKVNNAQKDFKAITIADYTFILNKNITAEMQSDTTENKYPHTAVLDLRNVNYGKTYSILINDTVVAAVRTPNGTNQSHSTYTTVTLVADALYHALSGKLDESNSNLSKVNTYAELKTSDGGRTAVYAPGTDGTFTRLGDGIIVIQKSSDFEVSIEDGYGGQNFLVCMAASSSSTKLPTEAPDGYVVHVKGTTNENTADDYYVKWDSSDRLWKECPAVGITYKINANTMPWALIRQADGTFSFEPNEWTDRMTGDDTSNPYPTFIDHTINDIFFYRNRLGFLSDENAILSASADFFNFWYNSAATIEDTDPIDVAVSSNKVAILTNAVPFSRELMLFSKEGQFVLSSSGTLTPKSVAVDQMTAFDYSDSARPIAIGQNIFFINDRVNYCSLMRYYTIQDVADLKNAEDVSAHIPSYIPVGIYRLSGNTTDNTITLLSNKEPNTVWVYKFLQTSDTLTQSAWGKWQFAYSGAQICLAEFINSEIYFLVNTEDGLFLEKSTLTDNVTDFPNETIRLFMDRKIEYTIPEDAPLSDYDVKTTINFKDIYGAVPHKTDSTTYALVNAAGKYYPITEWDTDGNFTLNGDVRGETFFIGRQYEFRVELSEIALKLNDNNEVTTEVEGVLKLRNYRINYSNSGVFQIEVDNDSKHTHYVYTNTTRTLGTASTILGVNTTYSGKFEIPVYDTNTDIRISIVSDNPLPLNIVSGGWKGYYIRRTLRI